MPGPIDLQILTPTETVEHAQVSEVYVPAIQGLAGVLVDHRPYVTELGPGEVSYKEVTGVTRFLFVSGGFLENRDNHVTILADQVIRSDALDQVSLERELAESLERTRLGGGQGLDAAGWAAECENQRTLRLKLEILRRQQAG